MSGALKVGIVGMGTIGVIHADAYQATGEAHVAAICDASVDRLETEGDRLNVPGRFTDYHDLLKSDVDAVSVCVPNALHREVAVAAAQAGKHVLLEKPMAISAAEAAEILTAVEGAGKVGQIGMCSRQYASSLVLREHIEAGGLGEIYYMRAVYVRRRGIPGLGGWFTTKSASGGGPLIDLGVHSIDLAMWLSGLWKPTSVSASTFAKFGPRMRDYHYVDMWAGPPRFDGVFDVEDFVTALIRFGDRATLSIEVSWAGNTPEKRYLELFGDSGGVRLVDDGPIRILTEHGDRPADLELQYDPKPNRFESQARKFIAACRGESPPPATLREGLVLMKLIDAIYASAEAAEEVAVDV